MFYKMTEKTNKFEVNQPLQRIITTFGGGLWVVVISSFRVGMSAGDEGERGNERRVQ